MELQTLMGTIYRMVDIIMKKRIIILYNSFDIHEQAILSRTMSAPSSPSYLHLKKLEVGYSIT